MRCLLLAATGHAFCSGMDLRDSTVSRAGTEGFDPRSTSQALRAGVQAAIRELWELDKPPVASTSQPGSKTVVQPTMLLIRRASPSACGAVPAARLRAFSRR